VKDLAQDHGLVLLEQAQRVLDVTTPTMLSGLPS